MAGDPPAPRARLLVLGAGPAQLGLLAAARARGLYVIAADRDPSAPGFPLADKRALVSTEDEQAIAQLAAAEGVDGIVAPGIDWPVGIAARIAERLGLPHPIDGQTGSAVTSKRRQRERLAAAGVPQPRSFVCAGLDEARAAAAETGYPCVVKPPDRQGQVGLSVAAGEDELPGAVEAAAAASRSGSLLVEELVDGPEVTVNALSAGGEFFPLTVTDRLLAPPPAFGVALAHVWPSEAATAETVEVARRAAQALGVAAGPTYTQVRMGPAGPVVVELAARLGGGHDAELCEAALGVPLNALALAAALGEPVELPSNTVLLGSGGGACVVSWFRRRGRSCAWMVSRRRSRSGGILDVKLYRRPGWRFGPLRRGGDRAGAVLAVGSSRDDALERARRAAETVRFVVSGDEA